MSKHITLLLALGLLATFLLYVPLPSKAANRTIVVPDDYSTIQQAINMANEGDIVYVKDGAYNGTIQINKSIVLQGASRKAVINNWLVDGKAAILITHDNVTVKGITIDNPASNTMWNEKRGIHILGASNCIVSDNFVTHCDYGEGIWLYQASNNLIEGNLVENGNLGISLGSSTNNIVIDNTIQGNSQGISLYDSAENNTVSGNELFRNNIGIELDESNGNEFFENEISSLEVGVQVGGYFYQRDAISINHNLFYHNNFIGNPKNYASPSVTINGVNYFDNGGEGNYYSDYKGEDADTDGIGDSPYTMVTQSVDVTDPYPLMKPWAGDNLPPVIRILSPENTAYAKGEVPLNFTISESASMMAYSIDGGEELTITGNITLTGLPNGNHTVVIYATDVSGNEAVPKTVAFTIDIPEPEIFSVLPIVIAAVLVALIVNAVLLVYLKKRRR